MIDSMFPRMPRPRPRPPVAATLVEPRRAIRSVLEVLSLSIDDVVNDGSLKRRVLDLYRISRRIDNESWLRRQLR